MQKIIIVIIYFASSYIYGMDYAQKSSTIISARFVLTDSQQPKIGMKIVAAVNLDTSCGWREVWPVVSYVNRKDTSTFKVLIHNGRNFEEVPYSKDKHGLIYFMSWSDQHFRFSQAGSYAHETEPCIAYTSETPLYKLQVSTIKSYAQSLQQPQLNKQAIKREEQKKDYVKAVIACVVAGTLLCGSMWWWLENNNEKNL